MPKGGKVIGQENALVGEMDLPELMYQLGCRDCAESSNNSQADGAQYYTGRREDRNRPFGSQSIAEEGYKCNRSKSTKSGSNFLAGIFKFGFLFLSFALFSSIDCFMNLIFINYLISYLRK